MTLLAETDSLSFLDNAATALGVYGYELRALLAIVLVCACCGLVGSLILGNRMAFFSDAMAHCALAGIGLGTLVTILLGGTFDTSSAWQVPLFMVFFGVILGLAISYVRERTNLGSDTVIGVFFAGAIGVGAMLLTALQSIQGKQKFVSPETLLFGSPLFVQDFDLLYLFVLLLLAVVVLILRYNSLLLGSFNSSLARSRGVPVRLDQTILIVLLAMIVNLSICAVGMLLVNAMLIVPAACAGNLARNMRQFFWLSCVVSLSCGLAGLQMSRAIEIPYRGQSLQFGPSGLIICLAVAAFFLTLWMKSARDHVTARR